MFRSSLNVSATLSRATRALSTNVSHQPPKKIHGTHGRYAAATYTAASKAGLLPTVENELLAFHEVVKKSVNLASYLANPTIPRQEKAVKVDQLLDEKKFSHITRNLFLTLAANGRIGESVKVIKAYEELMQASRGAVKVTIITAETLKKKQLETIQKAVLGMVGGEGSKSVDIDVVEDASILGGLQVLVGDQFLDLSVQSRINSLNNTLSTSI